jgi:hypothetical protein
MKQTRPVLCASARQQKEQGKMRIIRRRNWLIKRIALGLAVAAVAAPVAQARPSMASAPQDIQAIEHGPHRLGGALARGDTQASPSVVASVLGDEPSATGFDWGDAGFGAGLTLALVLGGGAVVATRRNNRVQTA